MTLSEATDNLELYLCQENKTDLNADLYDAINRLVPFLRKITEKHVSDPDLVPIPFWIPKQVEKHVIFEQQQDDCSPFKVDPQRLIIKTIDTTAGNLFVLESKRWAFDSVEELINTILKSIY